MSDIEWDAEDFEPVKPAPPVQPKDFGKVTDKWDGEDEEDEVKDNWDDEEKEEDRKDKTTLSKQTKKKKKIGDIIAEKEAKQLEEVERRKKEKEDSEKRMSPSEQLAEKIRMQKIREDSDLQIATDLLGITPTESEVGLVSLDAIDISTTENLESFRLSLIEKIRSVDRLERKPHFVTFLEDLLKDLCQNVDVEDVKKISGTINLVYNDKVKAIKQNKGKKKAAGKAKLNTGQGSLVDQVADYGFGYETYDDFI